MTRCGFPCCHVFGIIGEMSHEMISVQYWLVYHPHYGDDTALGRALLLAQSEQFVMEGCGVPISAEMLERVKLKMKGDNYPILANNTSEEQFQESVFVQECTACTYGDFDRYRAGDTSPSNYYGSGYTVALLKNNTKVYLTQKLADLHSLIGKSILSQSRHPKEHARTDSRKNVMTNVDLVTNHRHVEESHLVMMEKAMHDVTTKIINDIRKKHGENEQGKKNNNVALDKTVWAADTSPIGPVRKRKKNQLG